VETRLAVLQERLEEDAPAVEGKPVGLLVEDGDVIMMEALPDHNALKMVLGVQRFPSCWMLE
jgi:hypothetical protein